MAKTKAQMAEAIKQLEEQRRTQFLAIKEWEEKYNALVQRDIANAERIKSHAQSYDALLSSYMALKKDVIAGEDRIGQLELELRDTTAARDNWRRDFMAMQDAHRKMRENLFQQARLAGVLAIEGKGPFGGHTDLSN
jgi:chromosome segregation ATPase